MGYQQPRPRDFPGTGYDTWPAVVRDKAEEAKQENASLKRRVEQLELQVRELYARLGQGEPPALEVRRPDPGEQGYRQPGVTW